jgi:hypothetical protein
MKDGTQGDEFTSRLEVVEIGLDDDGEKITLASSPLLKGQRQRAAIRGRSSLKAPR